MQNGLPSTPEKLLALINKVMHSRSSDIIFFLKKKTFLPIFTSDIVH